MSKQTKSAVFRIIALLTASLMIAPAAGCKKNPTDSYYSTFEYEIQEDETNETESSTGSEEGDSADSKSDNSSQSTNSGTSGNSSGASLDDVKTDGKTFTIMSDYLPTTEGSAQYLFEKMFWKRVKEVEKEYGVKIKVIKNGVNANNLAPLIMAGKPGANVLEANAEDLTGIISSGYAIPWDNVKGVDVNNKNFLPGYTKVATYGGKHYGLYFEKPPELRYCVVMNKSLLKKNGIDADGIYTLVKNKQWNFDKMKEYAVKTTSASNNIYGVGGNPAYIMEMLIGSNGGRIISFNSSGKAVPSYTSNNVKQALEYMNDLVNVSKVFPVTSGMSSKSTYDSSKPDYTAKFIKGELAFLLEDSWVLNQQIRPKVKNFDYGLLPVPMGPSAKDYVSMSSHARVFIITKTNKDQAFTAKIFNALAEPADGNSGDQWWKDEIQLDYFQTNDKYSMDIYLQLINNMESDPGVGLANVWNDFKQTTMFEPIFWGGGKTTSAAVDSVSGKYDKTINSLF